MKITITTQKSTRPASNYIRDNKYMMSQQSSIPNYIFSTTQTNLFEGFYKGSNIDNNSKQVQPNSFKYKYRGSSVNLQTLLKYKSQSLHKNIDRHNKKSVQQLLEQNIYLKKQINILKEQLSVVKSRQIAKNINKLDILGLKQAQINFQKEIYWSNNQKILRIHGIRQQYDKLKKQFSDQSLVLEDVKKKLLNTGLKQAQIYIQELEGENKKLLLQIKNKTRYQKIANSQNKTLLTARTSSRSTIKRNSQLSNYQIAKRNQQKVPIQLPVQLKQIKNILKQKENKINFLQKCLINKANNEHTANCKARKYKKQHEILTQQLYKIKKQLQATQNKLQIQRIKIKSYFTHIINQTTQQFNYQKNQLHKKVQQLKNQNNILLQQIHKNKQKNNNMLIKSLVNINNQSRRKASMDLNYIRLFFKEQDGRISYAQSKRLNSQQKNNNSSMNNSQQEEQSYIIGNLKYQHPFRADKKNSQNSQKLRRIQYHQVKNLGQLLHYKMIGLKIQPNQIKQLFIRKKIFTEQSQKQKSQYMLQYNKMSDNLSKMLIQWQDQYINMKQILDILNNPPLNLRPEQSYLLARYLIEDCQEQYVYCDQINQNKRQIVKSILKSLIGPYSPIEQSQIIAIRRIIQKYKTNLKNILEIKYPSGLISQNKLIEVFLGIGIQLNQRDREIIIGKLSVQADELNQLKYWQIFDL